MKRLILILTAVAAVALLAGCAARSSACDVIDAAGKSPGQVQAPSQNAKQGDKLAGAAVREGGEGDNTNATSDTGVDVQAQNQNSGTIVRYASLVGDSKAAAEALLRSTPGEEHVVERLRATRETMSELGRQLAATPAAEVAEVSRLQSAIDAQKADEAAYLERLDGYAAKKLEAARTLAPDLSQLKTVIQLVVNPQGIGGMEYPLISDEQAKAIASVAGPSVEGVARMLAPETPEGGGP